MPFTNCNKASVHKALNARPETIALKNSRKIYKSKKFLARQLKSMRIIKSNPKGEFHAVS